jgi:DNA-binding transcriptional LysR family regulator
MDLLAQMVTFVRVVDGKSLSAAARAQRLSLPAVSRQLRALETDLGASLIVRSTRRLHVTDAGRQWYEHCVRVLREIDEARATVRDTNSVRGTIVVSASLTFGSVVIVPQLGKLVDKHPHLVVDLRLEDQLVDLVGEGVDVAVRAGSPPPDSTAFVAHPIFAMDRILVAAPRWLRKHGTPKEPEQLVRHECLVQVTPAGSVVRWRLRRGAEEQTIDVRGRVRTNAPIALRDLAVDGAGIAYLPDWLVTDDLARGRLRRVLPDWCSPSITAWALYRAELRGAPRLRAFLDAMPGDPTRLREG